MLTHKFRYLEISTNVLVCNAVATLIKTLKFNSIKVICPGFSSALDSFSRTKFWVGYLDREINLRINLLY